MGSPFAVQFPIDLQVEIVPRQRAFIGRRVEVGRLVKHMRLLREHAESMRKTSWDPQHPFVLARQSHRFPVAKTGRLPAQVNGDIQNLSLGHAHKLSLRMLHLKMQTPQNVAGRAGMIILHKVLNNSRIRHDLLVIALEEKPAPVPEHPWFENKHSMQRRRDFLERIHRRADCLNRTHQNTFSRKSCSK